MPEGLFSRIEWVPKMTLSNLVAKLQEEIAKNPDFQTQEIKFGATAPACSQTIDTSKKRIVFGGSPIGND